MGVGGVEAVEEEAEVAASCGAVEVGALKSADHHGEKVGDIGGGEVGAKVAGALGSGDRIGDGVEVAGQQFGGDLGQVGQREYEAALLVEDVEQILTHVQ